MNAGWSWGKQDTTVNLSGPKVTSASVIIGNGQSNGVGFGTPRGGFGLAYQESTDPNGAIGGVQIGYNWQNMSNWIFGVEADFQASGESASGNVHQTPQVQLAGGFGFAGATFASQSSSQQGALLWFGTVRGRVGYAIWPTVMLYGTGGLAYGRLNESVSTPFNSSCTTSIPPCSGGIALLGGAGVPVPGSLDQPFEAAVTKTGWTVGGGVEGAVPNTHVTWKVEYLYMDLGSENYAFSSSSLGMLTVSTHFTDNIVRVGLNYQFH